MGIIKRQSIKATIITYSGIAFAYLNIVILWPLCLQPDQIGLLRILPDVALILSIFVKFGSNNAAVKFFPRFNNPEKGHNGLLFNLIFFPFLLFIVFCVLFFLLKDVLFSYFLQKEPLLDDYIYWLLPFTFFTVYITTFETYANIHMRIVVPNLVKEVITRIMTALVLLLFYFQLIRFGTLVALYTCCFGFAALLIMLYIKRLKKLYLKPNWKFPDKKLRKEILRYSFFISLGGIGSILATKIDTVMVAYYDGLTNTGIFSTAALIAMVIEMPKRAINQISGPIVADQLDRGDTKALEILYRKSSVIEIAAGVFIFLGIWLNTDALFAIMPNGDTFKAGKFVIFYIGISKLFDMATSINYIIINNSRHYKVSIYTMLMLAGLAIATNMIFIPIYGYTGAAFATALSILIYNTVCVIFVYRKYAIQPFSMASVKILLIGAACYLIYYLPHLDNAIFDIAARSILLTVVYGSLVYFLKISEEINQTVRQAFAMLKR